MDLKARKFNCIIELWDIQSISDGFGGNTTQPVKVADMYARREELKRNPFLDNGQNITQQLYRFTIRQRHITSGMYLVYSGQRYDINDRHFTQLQSQIALDCINTGFVQNRTFDNTFDNTFY